MTNNFTKTCSYCGKEVPVEEIILLKNGFVCNVCYKQKKHKHSKYKKSRNTKEVTLGIIFCVLGVGLFLFAIWFWIKGISKGEGIMATGMAGGIIALAITLLKLGFGAFY